MKEYYKAELFLNENGDKQKYMMDVIIIINNSTNRCYELCTNQELIYDDLPYSPYHSIIKNITKVSRQEVDNYIINFDCNKFCKIIADGIDTSDNNYSNEYAKPKVKNIRKLLRKTK